MTLNNNKNNIKSKNDIPEIAGGVLGASAFFIALYAWGGNWLKSENIIIWAIASFITISLVIVGASISIYFFVRYVNKDQKQQWFKKGSEDQFFYYGIFHIVTYTHSWIWILVYLGLLIVISPILYLQPNPNYSFIDKFIINLGLIVIAYAIMRISKWIYNKNKK